MENPEVLVEDVSNSQVRITVCNSLSISTGVAYENFKPFYSIQEIAQKTDDIDEIISQRRGQIDGFLKADYNVYHNCRSKETPEHHRITVIDGVKYPSVTTILNPDKPSIPHLEEHGLIGTAFDACMKRYIDTGKLELGEVPLTPNVKDGWEKVFEQVKKMELSKFKFSEHSIKTINDIYRYTGELDALAIYEGIPVIVDFKKTNKISGEIKRKYLMQLSAYAKCSQNIEGVVILNPYNEPILELDIDKYFQMFLVERGAYRERYGV